MYCPGCGRAVQEDNKFCPHCGRPIGGHSVAPLPIASAERKDTSSVIIVAAVIAVVAAIAIILVLFVAFSGSVGPSADVTVTIHSYTSFSTVSYNVYFDGSLVKSGTVDAFSTDSFTHTHRWSSSDTTTVVISLEASGGLLTDFYSDQQTITVSDGVDYTVYMFV